MKKIVSVQDISCYGQCSLTVALPILSAHGIETAILPSAILSTHTGGFSDFTCLDLTEEMPKIVNHWKKEGLCFDAIYTGYIGDARQFDLIKSMKKDLLKPGGLLIADPAMADHGKLYAALHEDIVVGMRSLVRESDVILPNLTEAAFLLDVPYKSTYSRTELLEMARALSAMGPGLVILTGIPGEGDTLGALAYEWDGDRVYEGYAKRMPRNYHGTGDVFASVAVAGLLGGAGIQESLTKACEFVVKCIENTLPDASHGYGVKFETVLVEK